MAFTASQVASLENAIAAGVTTVSYGEKRVEYRSLADMRQILAEARLSAAGLERIRQVRVISPSDKGL